jgi:hypothetical protein
MKRRILTIILALALSAVSSYAEQIEFQNVAEMVKLSDLIARVTIVSVRETGVKDGYAKVAWVQVVEGLRGTKAGEFFELESEAVYHGVPIACPNVSYTAGEDVLLFARKLPDGNYHTLYADAGKFLVREGRVDKSPFKKGQSYRAAVAEVRREVKKLEDLAASKP